MKQVHKTPDKHTGDRRKETRRKEIAPAIVIPQRVVPLTEDLLKSIVTELGTSNGALLVKALRQVETSAQAGIATSEKSIRAQMNVLAKDVTLVREIAGQAATAASSADHSANLAGTAVAEVNKIADSISTRVNKALSEFFSATVQKNTGKAVEPVTLNGPRLIAYLTESVAELLQLFAVIKNQTAPDLSSVVSNVVNIVKETLFAPFEKAMRELQAGYETKLDGALATIEVLKKNQATIIKALQTVLGKNLDGAQYLQGMILADATPVVVNVLRQKGDAWKSEISQLVELVGKDNLCAVFSKLADKQPDVLIAALASEDGITVAEAESGYNVEIGMIQTRAVVCLAALSVKESV